MNNSLIGAGKAGENGQSSYDLAKGRADQTVGVAMARAIVISLSTGSPAGRLSEVGSMYSQATVSQMVSIIGEPDGELCCGDRGN